MPQDSEIRAGIRRAVHALVQTLGATSVHLQLPSPPIAGDSGEELGLRSPQFQGKQLQPVAVRRGSKGIEILVAADVLESTLGVADSGAVAASVLTFAAVQVGDETFIPTGTETVPCQGGACMYRILLRQQLAEGA